MSEVGLIHRHRRPHGITKADTETQDRENLIKRNFTADKPLKKLLTDITEVQCADGKLYVSPILDCFNGEIIALEMRDNMKKELCIGTVKQLWTCQEMCSRRIPKILDSQISGSVMSQPC